MPMNFAFRPIAVWPHGDTRPRRSRWAFKASWSSTLTLLERELRHLGATNCVIGAAFREQDLRLDGLPRADARVPAHPGIEISFDTPAHGRLVYATDSCDWWEHNVRSIALGLEALRAVDRFGITRRGEQYAGWKQLTAGVSGDVDRGRDLIRTYGGVREAIKATHPDAGGDSDDFRAVTAAREAAVTI
jgi:hypothetical protein